MALLTKSNCDLTADAIAESVFQGEAPSWHLKQVEWYRQDLIDCQTLLNSTGFLLQQGVIEVGSFTSIFQEILQDANLVDLGKASEDISLALDKQIAIREAQRVADQEAFQRQLELQQQFNDRVAGQLVDLGEASVEISEALEDQSKTSFFGDLVTGAIGGSSLLILGIILVVMIGRK